ncbi:MAG: Gfo/Idh/MocA family oxidoreductase [Clostridia bacterium]|nr:Gfo/Idh/MocA family oxidoreductase [Clostridia bacterium]
MYKIAILGCENSHANTFLRDILTEKRVSDVEVVGVYSEDREAAEKLGAEFGVPVADRPDQFVGEIDGLIITARHGAAHYPLAQPYIASGIPMFIDKPITIDEDEAVTFMRELKDAGVRVCGGSVTGCSEHIRAMQALVALQAQGKVLGGYLRAPVSLENPYGGFHFYCQHLVQAMTTIFGAYPQSVQAFSKENTITCIVRYEAYDVTLVFVEGNYLYYAAVSSENGVVGNSYGFETAFHEEFMEFYRLLQGGASKDYREFIAPVFIHNAIERALASGKEEPIRPVPEI